MQSPPLLQTYHNYTFLYDGEWAENDYISIRVRQNGTSKSCNHLLLLVDAECVSVTSEAWRLLVQFVTASVSNTKHEILNLTLGLKSKWFSKRELTNSQTLRTLFSLWCIHGMSAVDCTHQNSTQALVIFVHLSDCGSEACNPVYKKLVSSVCSQEVTVCFMLACAPNPLPARYFSQGPKRWKSLGERLWLLVRVLHNIQAITSKSVTTPVVTGTILRSNNTLVHQPSCFVMNGLL